MPSSEQFQWEITDESSTGTSCASFCIMLWSVVGRTAFQVLNLLSLGEPEAWARCIRPVWISTNFNVSFGAASTSVFVVLQIIFKPVKILTNFKLILFMILLFLLSKPLLHLPSEGKLPMQDSRTKRWRDQIQQIEVPHLKARQRFKFLAPAWIQSPELCKKPTYIVRTRGLRKEHKQEAT